MKRLRAVDILAGLLLLLAAASTIVLINSFRYYNFWDMQRNGVGKNVTLYVGRIDFSISEFQIKPMSHDHDWLRVTLTHAPLAPRDSAFGWDVRSQRAGTIGRFGGTRYAYNLREWWFPFWILLLLLWPIPIWRIARAASRWRTNRRAIKGCCVQCGYDLRATPDRCPECGTVAANGKGAAR